MQRWGFSAASAGLPVGERLGLQGAAGVGGYHCVCVCVEGVRATGGAI